MKKNIYISVEMNNSPLMMEMKNDELAGVSVVCNFVKLSNQLQENAP